jgi:hypothetical protein
VSRLTDSLKEHRGMAAVVVGALTVGVGAGYWLSRDGGPSGGKPDQAIEWHAVQAVPTRAPDADDVQWQDRSNAIDAEDAAANAAGKDDADADSAAP